LTADLLFRRRSFETLPAWFPYLDLACALAAGALWDLRSPWMLPLTLALAPWLARLLLVGRLTRRTPFDAPLALFVVTAGLAVWAAFDKEVAWHKFWLVVGAVFIFYALVNAQSLLPWERRSPLRRSGDPRAWLLALLGGIVSLYFLAGHDWAADPAKLDAITRLGLALQAPLPSLAGHSLTANVTGGILALTLPFAGAAAVAAWRAPGRRVADGRRLPAILVAAALLVLILLGLFLSTSRGAWMGTAVALLLALLWLAANRLAPRLTAAEGAPPDAEVPRVAEAGPGLRRRQRQLFYCGVAVAGALLLLLVAQWPGGLPAFVRAVVPGGTGLNRLALWSNSRILVQDYALIGSGLGGYTMLYSTYTFLIHVAFSSHSHNLFLNIAIEQGLPALLLFGAMCLIFWGRVEEELRPRGQGRQTAVAPALGAAALALVIMLVHGLVDDTLYGSRALLILFAPFAFAASHPQPPATRPLPLATRHLLFALAAILLTTSLLLWQPRPRALYFANLGAVYQSRAELAVYDWPAWDIQDSVRREVDLSAAVAAYERALVLNPSNATANRRLGQIALSRGDYSAALLHLERAYAATPWDNATRQLLGEAYVVNGRVAEAAQLWATVNNSQGQLELRAYWYHKIQDEQRAAWAREAIGQIRSRE
jgi:O-antigen ligase